MSEAPAFSIRPLATHADYHAAELLQRTIWGMTDDIEIVPLHVLITAQKNGGLVAGAFDSRDEMLGLLFGFLGTDGGGRLKHCSHLMGVRPDMRRSGIGEALKRFQADFVRGQGIDLITWTFDPLEGVNASLNIGKLRAIASVYHANLYGAMPDGLNAGLPSDRFEVAWWLNSSRVIDRAPRPSHADRLAAGAFVINPTAFAPTADVPVPTAIWPLPDPPPSVIVAEVPANYQAIKAASLELALTWRLHSRDLFERLFAAGYTVTDFLSERPDGSAARRNYYVLERNFRPGG